MIAQLEEEKDTRVFVTSVEMECLKKLMLLELRFVMTEI